MVKFSIYGRYVSCPLVLEKIRAMDKNGFDGIPDYNTIQVVADAYHHDEIEASLNIIDWLQTFRYLDRSGDMFNQFVVLWYRANLHVFVMMLRRAK